MKKSNYKNWHLSTDENDIAILKLDKAGSATNVLAVAVLIELDKVLEHIKTQQPKGLIIISAKDTGFIAGADINEFLEMKTPSDVKILVKRGQDVFTKLENLNCLTVCAIDGFCMGGGTELALACDFRVATDSSNTKIGLPEVKLGIHPAFGGIVRSVNKLNPINAMQWMLTGRALSAKQAKRLKLVNFVVPKRQLLNTSIYIIQNKLTKPRQSKLDHAMNLWPIRPLIASYMKRKTAEKVREEHYPAPFAMIDIWSKYGDNPDQLMKQEVNSVTELMHGDTVRNLIRVFFLQTQLKSQASENFTDINHIHVIGAGIMGGDIAIWCAAKGFTVTLQDQKAEYLEKAMGRASKLFRRRSSSKAEFNLLKDRLIPDIKGNGVKKADLVIEAIFENADVKKELYKVIEPQLKPNAFLATNTSSIPLDTLAKGLKNPNRFVGLHFFNPVPQMPLVEIITTPLSDESIINRSLFFCKKLGKLPLVVKSVAAPGFLVNRILVPYLLEAMMLLDEGEQAERIDQAALEFGMPMGPIELADTVGLDICYSIASNFADFYGFEIPQKLESMITLKKLGKKSGYGFYPYDKGKAVKDKQFNETGLDLIKDRLSMRIINESYACLRDGIVSSRDLLDAGVIFGTGFAPFTGGPLNYALSKDEIKIKELLIKLTDQFDQRFKPDEYLN